MGSASLFLQIAATSQSLKPPRLFNAMIAATAKHNVVLGLTLARTTFVASLKSGVEKPHAKNATDAKGTGNWNANALM